MVLECYVQIFIDVSNQRAVELTVHRTNRETHLFRWTEWSSD